MSSGKVKSVEGLRGIACLVVLLSHLSLIFYPYLHGQKEYLIKSNFDRILSEYPLGFLYSGTSAVFIFFCLSGYILTFACFKSTDIVRSSARMAVARYVRLILPVSASVIFCYITIKIIPDETIGLSWISAWGEGLHENNGFFNALYNGLFSSVFLSDTRYNPVTWTMEIELLGSYLLLCSLPLIGVIRYKFTTCIIICLIFILSSPNKIGISYASFFIGASIYWIKAIHSKKISILILIFGLYLAGYKELNHMYTWISSRIYIQLPGGVLFGYYFIPMISGFILVYVAVKSDVINLITSNKFSIILGRLSFSAYLIQVPVFYIITPRIKKIISLLVENYDAIVLVSSLTSILFIYLLAIAFNMLIDNPCIKLSRLVSARIIVK